MKMLEELERLMMLEELERLMMLEVRNVGCTLARVVFNCYW